MKTKLVMSLFLLVASGIFFLGVQSMSASDGSGWYETKDCREAFPRLCPDGGGCSVRVDKYLAAGCKIRCVQSNGYQDKYYEKGCFSRELVDEIFGTIRGTLDALIAWFWKALAA
jgi:hypothetical protein